MVFVSPFGEQDGQPGTPGYCIHCPHTGTCDRCVANGKRIRASIDAANASIQAAIDADRARWAAEGYAKE